MSEPAVDSLLDSIREGIVAAAGPSLVGLYVFGSLASGDFDTGVSDVDLLAVLAEGPGRRLAARLERMHADLARANPAWDDRIEEWAGLIRRALGWRRRQWEPGGQDGAATVAETRAFVTHMVTTSGSKGAGR